MLQLICRNQSVGCGDDRTTSFNHHSISVALSVITYKQLTFELSQVLSRVSESSIESDKTVQLCITLNNMLQVLTQFDTRTICDNEIQRHCGPGLWWREAYLNMSDPSQ